MGGKVLELESDKLIKKGEQIGKQIGEKAVTELTKKLLAENRLDDLKKKRGRSCLSKKITAGNGKYKIRNTEENDEIYICTQ